MTSNPPDGGTERFADLDLPQPVLDQLSSLGYEEPTAIQAQAIPPLLAGDDVLGQAATGTGKTAAFALPMLARMHAEGLIGQRGPAAVVVVPTRELAAQVSQAVHRYGDGLGVRVLPVYGGQPMGRQINRLQRGVDVVVATPGRAVDHLRRGTLRLDGVRIVVLDEADEMLDMGFEEDLDAIFDAAPDERQTALFSATMPSRVARIGERRMRDPRRITVSAASAAMSGDAPDIVEHVVVTPRHHKQAALTRVLDVEDPTACLVFCRTRQDVEDVARALSSSGRDVSALHGGMDQRQRDRVLDELRRGDAEIVVATDVAARGLDVDILTHVVNHSLPTQPEQYVHRIGRVGRAGRRGVAITLVEPRESRALQAIERHVGRTLSVRSVPSVEDLQSRRVAQVVHQVGEAMDSDHTEVAERSLEELQGVAELRDIAVAALAALHEERAGDHDDTHVPEVDLKRRPDHDKGSRGKGQGQRDRSGTDPADAAAKRRAYKHADAATANVWLSVGRNVGVRPKDIVGAVAGETHLSGSDIGQVQILGRFSLVEVPAEAVDQVCEQLKGATVRGKSVHAKPDRRD